MLINLLEKKSVNGFYLKHINCKTIGDSVRQKPKPSALDEMIDIRAALRMAALEAVKYKEQERLQREEEARQTRQQEFERKHAEAKLRAEEHKKKETRVAAHQKGLPSPEKSLPSHRERLLARKTIEKGKSK